MEVEKERRVRKGCRKRKERSREEGLKMKNIKCSLDRLFLQC